MANGAIQRSYMNDVTYVLQAEDSSYERIRFQVCFICTKLVSYPGDCKMFSGVPLLMIDCFILATSERQGSNEKNAKVPLYLNITNIKYVTSL